MRAVKWVIFGLGALFALAAPLLQIFRAEYVVRTGTEWRVAAAPLDPYDPFRGRYLELSLALDSYQAESEEERALLNRTERGEVLYFTLAADEKGLAELSGVFAEPPSGSDYLRREVEYSYSGKVRLRPLVERYFVNEAIAPAVDEAMGRRRTDSVALIRVRDGVGILVGLEVDGVPVAEYAQRAADSAE